jgi:D-aminoacyl-tRNA deacylase
LFLINLDSSQYINTQKSLINILIYMRIVVQRVSEASVRVNESIIGSIGKGLLVLAGFHVDDTREKVQWLCEKLVKLRIFNDTEGKMNLSVQDVGGDLLVVSQFTLYGDARKGTRPSYIDSARPETAIPLYEFMVEYLRTNSGLRIATGEFGAMMQVSLINDGPVTLILDR